MRTIAALLIVQATLLQAGCALTFDQRVERFVERSIARENAEKAARVRAANAYAASSVASVSAAAGVVAPTSARLLSVQQSAVDGSEDCVVRHGKAALVRGADGAMRIARGAEPLQIECSLAPTKAADSPMSISGL